MSASLGVSVIICTYNGKKNLAPTLEHLAAQKGIDSLPVEIIVVDNASTDATSDFVREKWLQLGSQIPLRIIQEKKIGKAYASETGFNSAKYDFILVCDDDNWLSEFYIKTVYDIIKANDNIGVIGGRGEAVFEGEKPDWFDTQQTIFAVGEQCSYSGDVTDKIDFIWGAGMTFRKKVWTYLQTVGYRFFLNEKRDEGGNWGGDDVELCEMIRVSGFRLWIDNRLSFKHFIPKGRASGEYLRSRFFGLGRSRVYLHAYVYCRHHHQPPGENLKYPLWIDKLYYLLKEYFSLLPEFIFHSPQKLTEGYLKFIALKGEIFEVWRLKAKYGQVFATILDFKRKIESTKIIE